MKQISGSRSAPSDRTGAAGARLVPTQKRSRERFELILACATQILVDEGSEALRMSDLVQRTGIPFGSLYQYFPDKIAIIATLAERYNAIGRECVSKDLAKLSDATRIHGVLCAITDSYYGFFRDEPVVHAIWQATQADRALQRIDAEEGAFLTGLLIDALKAVSPRSQAGKLASFAEMTMILIAAAVHHAVALPPRSAKEALATFKALLPRQIV